MSWFPILSSTKVDETSPETPTTEEDMKSG